MASGSPSLYIRLRSINTREWLAPPELRELLVQRAKERESSLTDVVVDILADRYRIEVDSTGRSTDPKMDKDFLAVRLPARLDTALAVSAAKRSPKRNRQREAMVALCEHFGLDVPPPPRRGRVARAV